MNETARKQPESKKLSDNALSKNARQELAKPLREDLKQDLILGAKKVAHCLSRNGLGEAKMRWFGHAVYPQIIIEMKKLKFGISLGRNNRQNYIVVNIPKYKPYSKKDDKKIVTALNAPGEFKMPDVKKETYFKEAKKIEDILNSSGEFELESFDIPDSTEPENYEYWLDVKKTSGQDDAEDFEVPGIEIDVKPENDNDKPNGIIDEIHQKVTNWVKRKT